MSDDEPVIQAVVAAPTQPKPVPRVYANTLAPNDIVWIDLPAAATLGREQAKNRPWIVVSSTRYNAHREMIIGVPLSTQIRPDLKMPSRVQISVTNITYLDADTPAPFKLDRVPRVALCDHIKSLSELRILYRSVGQVALRKMDEIRDGISHNLDL